METLWRGDPAAKRAAAEDAYDLFAPLRSTDGGQAQQDREAIIESLTALLWAEEDDWISYRLLQEIDLSDSEILDPVFLEALRNPSPNLRWCGIRRFSEHRADGALPSLEKAWNDEERPWVRADLIAALARHGASTHLEDFIRLSRSEDTDLASAAIRALGSLADPRAIPTLTKLARSGAAIARVDAVTALSEFFYSTEAMQTVIEASRTEEPGVQRAAVSSLPRFEGGAAADRLLEIARTRGDASIRRAAIKAIEDVRSPLATPTLIEILYEPIPEDEEYLHWTALQTLRALGDPSAVDGLLALPPILGALEDDVASLISFLSRDRSREHRTVTVSSSCGGWLILDADDPRTVQVVPPPGTDSIRCWEAPERSGDPEEFRRIPAGTLARIIDHFERADESWAQIDGRSPEGCWVPRRFLDRPVRGTPDEGHSSQEGRLRREFDLPAGELEPEPARILLDSRLLRVIDPAEEVVGLALEIDPRNEPDVLVLVDAFWLAEGILEGEILRIARQLPARYKEDPEFADLFALTAEEEDDN